MSTYHLPGWLGAALSSNRPELMRFTQPLTAEQQKDILLLVADMIRERQDQVQKQHRLVDMVKELCTTLRGHADKLDEVLYGS